MTRRDRSRSLAVTHRLDAIVTAPGRGTGVVGRAWCGVTLSYHASLPLAVRLTVETDNHWYLARDLLRDGVRGMVAGDGDVRVYPEWNGESSFAVPPARVAVRLTGVADTERRFASAVLSLPRVKVVRFLDRTDLVVPREREEDVMREIIDRELGNLPSRG